MRVMLDTNILVSAYYFRLLEKKTWKEREL